MTPEARFVHQYAHAATSIESVAFSPIAFDLRTLQSCVLLRSLVIPWPEETPHSQLLIQLRVLLGQNSVEK